MKEAERDKLTIERDALLEKKRVLDAIEKLRVREGIDSGEITTTLEKFQREIANKYRLDDFTRLVRNSFNSIDKLDYRYGNKGQIILRPDWDTTLIIIIKDGFSARVKTIREEYHRLNNLLNREVPTPKDTKLVMYTSLYWLSKRAMVYVKKHKLRVSVFGVISFALALVAADYEMASKNINIFCNYLTSFFSK